MDWDWLKAFPNVKRAIQRHENHGELAKARPRYLLLLAGLPLLLIAGLIRWRLKWLKAYQQKLAAAVDRCVTIVNSIRQKLF